MSTDDMKRRTGDVVSGLVALGLAFGLTAGVDAQERTQETERQQDRQEQELSEDEIEDSMSDPDQELQELAQHRDLQAQNVKVVRIGDVVRDREKRSELRQEHQDKVQRVQTELRGNQSLSQALEQQNIDLEDVLAVHVKDSDEMQDEEMRRQEPEQEGERREMAAEQPTVFVVVSGSGAADRPGEYQRDEPGQQQDRGEQRDPREDPEHDPQEAPPEDWPEDRRPETQDPQYEDVERETTAQQQGQMTEAHLEEALAEPTTQLRLLERRDMQRQNVEVVRVEEVVEDAQRASDMRGRHLSGVQKFQEALRDNEELMQALEQENVGVEDVLAVRVVDQAGQQGRQQEGERQEMAADQPTVFVVVSSDTGAADRPGAQQEDRPGQEDRGQQGERPWEDERERDRGEDQDRAERQDRQQQERPQQQERQPTERQQDQELTESELQQALASPERELQSLEEQRDLQEQNVKVVRMEDIVQDEQRVSEMRDQHAQDAEQFRSELRGNQTLMQALERQNVDVEDVLGVHVKDRTAGDRQQEGERTEMGAEQPTVFVIVSDLRFDRTEDEDEGYPRI